MTAGWELKKVRAEKGRRVCGGFAGLCPVKVSVD